MLAAMLSRTYEATPTGNGRASLLTPEIRTRIFALYGEGKKPAQIARELGLGRKQVSRVIHGW